MSRERLLVQAERLRIAAAPVMNVADVVQPRDFAVAVATGAIQRERPLIAGERVVVAPEIQVGEADRVEIPGRVRLLTECLVNDQTPPAPPGSPISYSPNAREASVTAASARASAARSSDLRRSGNSARSAACASRLRP